MPNDDRPTLTPPRWPSLESLFPRVEQNYPVPANTDAIETVRPAACEVGS